MSVSVSVHESSDDIPKMCCIFCSHLPDKSTASQIIRVMDGPTEWLDGGWVVKKFLDVSDFPRFKIEISFERAPHRTTKSEES